MRSAEIIVYPFMDYWWFYAIFILAVLGLVWLDLRLFHREAHAVKMREAAGWSVFWVVLALTFNWIFYRHTLNLLTTDPRFTSLADFDANAHALRLGLEFLTGYLVEKSLSLDNIFVFVVVFNFFGIPGKYQHRVLFLGILGALIFRGIFITLGAILLQYQFILLAFGALLIFTGVKLFFAPEKPIDPSHNFVMRFLKRRLPLTEELDGQKFFVKRGAKWVATPLFLALVFIEMTDIVFAIDSVPAIFAITREPLIVFTSNVFAILGLRAMYFLLANVVTTLHLIKYGLGVILIFVGLKMVWLNDLYDGHFPIIWSLGIIGGVMLITTVLSLMLPRHKNT